MYFLASKVLWLVASPGNALLLAIGCGLLLALTARWRRPGLWLALASLLLLAVVGFSPLARWLTAPLEDRFAPWQDDGRPVAGIIVLGGPVDQDVSLARGQLSLNEAGERLLAMAMLARRYPAVPVLFAGGSAALVGQEESEAAVVGRFIGDLGLPPGRVMLEQASRNTHENALRSAEMLHPGPGRRFVLVTSAFHMPRSVGLFRKAGFDVLPWPVDYRTTGTGDADGFSRVSDGLRFFEVAAREWVGLAAARLFGQTDALFPAP